MHSNNWQLDISVAGTLMCLEVEEDKLGIIVTLWYYSSLFHSYGEHIIYHPNQNIFESKKHY